MDKGTKIDFIGVILNIGKPSPIKGKRGEPSLRINLHLGETSLNSINVGIWGGKIVNDIETKLVRQGWAFDKRNPVVCVIQNCRISDYDFRSLNVYEEEVAFFLNPQTPAAGQMRMWISQQADDALNFVNVASHKLQMIAERKALQDAKEMEQQKAMMNARFELDTKTFMPIHEIFQSLTNEIPLENFKQRCILKKIEHVVPNEAQKFHIAGYLSGFKLEDSPYYKACPGCHRRFTNQLNDYIPSHKQAANNQKSFRFN